MVICFYVHFVLYNWVIASILNKNKCVNSENIERERKIAKIGPKWPKIDKIAQINQISQNSQKGPKIDQNGCNLNI